VQTIVISNQAWKEASTKIMAQYGLSEGQIKEALLFYQAHLVADASRKDLHAALVSKGHDVTRTPAPGPSLDANDKF